MKNSKTQKGQPEYKEENDGVKFSVEKEVDGLESFPTLSLDEESKKPIRTDFLLSQQYRPNFVVKLSKKSDQSAQELKQPSFPSRHGHRNSFSTTIDEVNPTLGTMLYEYASGLQFASLLGTDGIETALREYLSTGRIIGIGVIGSKIRHSVTEVTYSDSESERELNFNPKGDLKICLTHFYQRQTELSQSPTACMIALLDLDARTIAYITEGNQSYLKIELGRMRDNVTVESPTSSFRYNMDSLARLYLVPIIKKFKK